VRHLVVVTGASKRRADENARNESEHASKQSKVVIRWVRLLALGESGSIERER
jgi:hypothetical protein